MNESKSQHSGEDVNLVKMLLSNYAPLHIHKENMAYAGILLQFGLFGTIMKAEQWPPYWLQCEFFALILFFVAWLLIHMFIGWQLNKRRLYAKIINAATRYFWGKLPSNVSDQDRTKVCPSELCAMFIWPSSFTKSDVEIELPKELSDLLKCEKKPGTGIEEMILFVISIGMFFLILLRIL
jgi:hypothetical protein